MKLLILPATLAGTIFLTKFLFGLPAAGLTRHWLIDTGILFFLSIGIYKLANTSWLFPNRSNAALTIWDNLFGLEHWVRTPPGSWRNFSGPQLFGLFSLGLTLGYLVLRIYPVVLAKDEAMAVIKKNSPKEIAAAALHECAMPMGKLQTVENSHFFLHPAFASSLHDGCVRLREETERITKASNTLYVEWNSFSAGYQTLHESGEKAVVTFAPNRALGAFNWETASPALGTGEGLQQLLVKKIALRHGAFAVELQRHENNWLVTLLPQKIFQD